MTDPQPGEHVQQEMTQGITEYLYGILPNTPDSVVRDKAKQAIVQSQSPNSNLSYEGLVAERAFSDENFLRKWKPIFEPRCYADPAGDHPGPMNELSAPIKVAVIAAVIASMKESSPGTDGLRFTTLRAIPVEVITILFNLLLLRGNSSNIFTSRVTFIKKLEVPGDPLQFRPIAIRNYFVRVFHQVLASRLEASLPNSNVLTGLPKCPQTECDPTHGPRQTREPGDRISEHSKSIRPSLPRGKTRHTPTEGGP
ncbi:unnamed protein product [Acanthosepion pharaonis]|uniref:Uncharacterized protein n=1 Tax=Acanthosepion pharaonis TaxID=158019 RepID=A0A812E5V0_ACAPH|nr:unnamed protein product [Sepia pharaonis]